MRTILGLLVMLAVVLTATATTDVAVAQVKIPPDSVFPTGKDSPGPVNFSHTQHKEKVEKCQGCHTKIFKMKKGTSGPFTMARMEAGELCGTCHNGKTEVGGKVVPLTVTDKDTCAKCHKKS